MSITSRGYPMVTKLNVSMQQLWKQICEDMLCVPKISDIQIIILFNKKKSKNIIQMGIALSNDNPKPVICLNCPNTSNLNRSHTTDKIIVQTMSEMRDTHQQPNTHHNGNLDHFPESIKQVSAHNKQKNRHETMAQRIYENNKRNSSIRKKNSTLSSYSSSFASQQLRVEEQPDRSSKGYKSTLLKSRNNQNTCTVNQKLKYFQNNKKLIQESIQATICVEKVLNILCHRQILQDDQYKYLNARNMRSLQNKQRRYKNLQIRQQKTKNLCQFSEANGIQSKFNKKNFASKPKQKDKDMLDNSDKNKNFGRKYHPSSFHQKKQKQNYGVPVQKHTYHSKINTRTNIQSNVGSNNNINYHSYLDLQTNKPLI